MLDWEPDRYLRFADQRSRPFFDLLARVPVGAPRRVVDLGCGPGQLTAGLLDRWPQAEVVGVDSSPAMIAAGQQHARAGVRFVCADLRTWRPAAPVDVLISNAALQWVPGHRELLPELLTSVAGGGWFAFQVPGNFAEPSHRLLRTLAADPRFRPWTDTLTWPAAHQPEEYLADLSALGCAVDAWETTYLHLLTGPDPVFSWIAGTGARPVLQALPDRMRRDFEAEFRAALREAYPSRPYGTVLPFRRVFVVAHRGRSEC